ncbi:relaxase/mobilization nuclease domain-containing protein [Mucilaginibacter ginsenosidivorans]|uniref:Relaxase n=1 Tax=Mucilaginibacter ginsenosidivorans TaxID=398053 RepID=A0A5B8UUE8_9SPHI|nr:relaxase/mobilization nuclease domain-containing protein [Mucilaginibacter ginsenosidivorans]QEC61971.1 relaxase [Mucilaginibacter ginsenosidivorans]
MVAVIHVSRRFHNVLNYNEKKVREQVAVCLEAANYPKNAADLSFNQKLKRLENQASLNERTIVNCVHISLNFDPSEQLSGQLLKELTAEYMDKIGFGEQPYLLYRHNDAGHPHVHIVSTNIKADGRRIELHNLGKNQSEKARKEIELKYGLLRPEDSKNRQRYELNPVNVQKVSYGKTATKRAITTVLSKVISEYKYSSLPELNAILQQYNVVADRGTEHSRINKNNGLVYRILNEQGERVGVPIKASDFYNKPTLKYLQERFKVNEPQKANNKARLKNSIDFALLKKEKQTIESLAKALDKEGINLVLRRNEQGYIYGITYVDHRTKCVFNGSDLGKNYSAKAVIERCNAEQNQLKSDAKKSPQIFTKQDNGDSFVESVVSGLGGELLRQEYTGDNMPYDLKKKRKKRKRISND